MWNWLGLMLFPGVHSELDNWKKAHDAVLERWSKQIDRNVELRHKASLAAEELACFRDNAAHSEAMIIDLDTYITQCERQTVFYKNELRSLSYASDERIAEDCKHYAKNRDECVGEVARLKRMMAREQARVYELGRANDELVARMKGKVAATLRRPEVHLGMDTNNSAQSIASTDFAQRTAEDRTEHAAERARFHKQTGELKTP